jgi:hypothetical protein
VTTTSHGRRLVPARDDDPRIDAILKVAPIAPISKKRRAEEGGISSLLNNPAHWHLRAQKAQLLASQLDDPVAKVAALKIAEEYERLATRAAKRETDKATK